MGRVRIFFLSSDVCVRRFSLSYIVVRTVMYSHKQIKSHRSVIRFPTCLVVAGQRFHVWGSQFPVAQTSLGGHLFFSFRMSAMVKDNIKSRFDVFACVWFQMVDY